MLVGGFKRAVAVGIIAIGSLLTNATLVFADWRKDLGTFRIGIVESSVHQFSPTEITKIRDAYSKTLAMPVEVIAMRDFPALIDAQASSRIEYAIYSAAAYATAWISCECVAPIVAPVEANGTMGSKSVLFLDKSINLNEVTSSKGIAIAGKDSLSAYGAPLSEFLGAGGVALTGNETWLKAYDSNSAAVTAVGLGEVDGLFAAIPDNQTITQPLDPNSPIQAALLATGRNLVAVWQSQAIPFGPHAIRKNLNPQIKELLQSYLVNLADQDPAMFELLSEPTATGFVPIAQEKYNSTIKAVKALADYSKQQVP